MSAPKPQSGILINGQLYDFAALHLLPPHIRTGLALQLLKPPPVRHAEPSMIFSLDDEPWRPSARLFDLAAAIAAQAPRAAHPLLAGRAGAGQPWWQVFPGEHYNLLTTLCQVLAPKTVWEFGTDTGMGTIAMLEGLGADARISTVDIDAWSSKPGSWLTRVDFDPGRVTQIVASMSSRAFFKRHAESLEEAELVFVDGPKDGSTEIRFLELMDKIAFKRAPIVLFDDIRTANMLAIWRQIKRPKMDITSYGHWSGSGLVDWSG